MERSSTPRVWAVAFLLILCAGFVSAASTEVAPTVDGVPFVIRFHGTVRGLAPGATVEVQGIRIGEVKSVGVDYAPDGNSFVASVGIVLQPSLFPAAGVQPRTATEVYDAADVLVQRGLRAQISDTQLLGGDAIVTLDIQPGAAPATLDRSGKVPELPAVATQQERGCAAAPAADRQARQCADRSNFRRATGLDGCAEAAPHWAGTEPNTGGIA